MAVANQQNITVGDRVKIISDLEVLEGLQQGHGEWNEQMWGCRTAVGRVEAINENGDCVVVYPSGSSWTFNPEALIRVSAASSDAGLTFERQTSVALTIGDVVQLSTDAQLVKELLREHGGWQEDMREMLGR